MRLKALAMLASSLLVSTHVFAESSLRVRCLNSDAQGARVFLNNQEKGSCPLNLFLDEGTYKITAIKSVDETTERRFEKNIKIGKNADERIDIVLGEAALTPAAQKQLNVQRLQEIHQLADNGDVEAIEELIGRYTTGEDVVKSPKKVAELKVALIKAKEEAAIAEVENFKKNLIKEAEAKNLDSIQKLSLYYREGIRGFEKNEEEAARWEQYHLTASQEAVAHKFKHQMFLDYAIAETQGMVVDPSTGGVDLFGLTTTAPTFAAAVVADLVASPITTAWQLAAKKGYFSASARPAKWGNQHSLIARAEKARLASTKNSH